MSIGNKGAKYDNYNKKPYYDDDRYRANKRHESPPDRRYEYRKEDDYRKKDIREPIRDDKDLRDIRENRDNRDIRDKPFVEARPYRDAPSNKSSQYYIKGQGPISRPYYPAERPKYRRSRQRDRDRYSSSSRSYRRHRSRSRSRSRSSRSYSYSRSRSRSPRSRSYSYSSSYSHDSRRKRGSSRSPYRYRNRSPKRDYPESRDRPYRGNSRDRGNVKRKDSPDRKDYVPQYKDYRDKPFNKGIVDRKYDREKDRVEPPGKETIKGKDQREQQPHYPLHKNVRDKDPPKPPMHQIKNIPPPPPPTVASLTSNQGPFLKRSNQPQKIQIDFEKIVYEAKPPPTLEPPPMSQIKPTKRSPNQQRIQPQEPPNKVPLLPFAKPKRQKQIQFIRPDLIPKPPAPKPLSQTEQLIKAAKSTTEYKLPDTSFILLQAYRRLDGYEFQLEGLTQQWRLKLQDDKSSINLLRSQWISSSTNSNTHANGDSTKQNQSLNIPPRHFKMERSQFVNPDFQMRLEQLADELRNKARIIGENSRKVVMHDIQLEMLVSKRVQTDG